MSRIYLDANATTAPLTEVQQVMADFQAKFWGNPSSVHTEGRRARAQIEGARATLACVLGVDSNSLVFTSGATEANSAAIHSAAHWGRQVGKTHIVTTAVEHPSILGPIERLVADEGFTCTKVVPDEAGRIQVAQILSELRDDTCLVALMAANNEIGNIYPVNAVGQALKAHGDIAFHVDCVQLLGKQDFDIEAMGVTTASFSGHKVYGPKGVGVLYVSNDAYLRPFVVGGHQERERRAGTESGAAIVGFAIAAKHAVVDIGASAKKQRALCLQLWEGLSATIDGVHLNGDPDPDGRIPNTLNVSFDGTEGETVLISLDLAEVSASSGSACTAGSLEPSHVLIAMGLQPGRSRAAIRFSLDRNTTTNDIERVVALMPDIIEMVRSASPETRDLEVANG